MEPRRDERTAEAPGLSDALGDGADDAAEAGPPPDAGPGAPASAEPDWSGAPPGSEQNGERASAAAAQGYAERWGEGLDAVLEWEGTAEEAMEWAESADPAQRVAGLALAAGLGFAGEVGDLAAETPELALAAMDLCAATFGPAAARALEQAWAAAMGGEGAAGVAAHTLLLEARLLYGGGVAALDWMEKANDPQAVFVGLRGFAADGDLPVSIRMEALVRLRAQSDFETYQAFVRRCAEGAAGEDEWTMRAARLLERVDGPPQALAVGLAVDRAFVEEALGREYPGWLEDLESLLRNGLGDGWARMDAAAAARLAEAVGTIDEEALAAPDRAAWLRLRWGLEGWSSQSMAQ